MSIQGTAGNDTLVGTSHADKFILTQGGNDTASGADGNDTFTMGHTFAAGDSINGGTGNDVIALSGDYSDGLTITGAMMASVENLTLAAGASYALTLDNDAVTIGHALAVDASALGSTDVLLFDGTAETTSSYAIIGGAGDDILYGGAANDSFDLSHGGNDEAHGGAGSDRFTMGGAFTAADQIDGGAGSDKLYLNGDYTETRALVLTDSTLTDVEKIILGDGYGYDLTIVDANIPSGGRLTVDGSGLVSGGFFHLDISGVDGTGVPGEGVTVTGGAYNDTIVAGGLLSTDRIDGGGGFNTVEFDRETDVTLNDGTLQNIQNLVFMPGSDPANDYAITTGHRLVPERSVLYVDASELNADDALLFNGARQNTGGSFAFTGGPGNDVLAGGSGNDTFDLTFGGDDSADGGRGDNTFYLGAALTAADQIDGGSSAGHNVVVLDGDLGGYLTFTPTTMTNIAEIDLEGDHSYGFQLDANNLVLGQSLTVYASALGPGYGTGIDASRTAGDLTFFGSSGDDEVFAGTGAVTASGSGGDDRIFITSMWSADQVDGGAGNDTLVLTGNTFVIFGTTTVLNVETIVLLTDEPGGSFDLTTNDATVAAGQTLTVDNSNTGFGGWQYLTFDGSAETDGAFMVIGGGLTDIITGGAGADTLAGGAGGDTMNGGAGADTITGGMGQDRLTGGSGNDTFVFGAASESSGVTFDVITDLNYAADKLNVAGTVSVIDTKVTGATLDGNANFDSELTTAASGHLGGAGHAILISASGGSLVGETFLVVDQNGTAGYQSGGDLVIEVPGATGTLTTGVFI